MKKLIAKIWLGGLLLAFISFICWFVIYLMIQDYHFRVVVMLFFGIGFPTAWSIVELQHN